MSNTGKDDNLFQLSNDSTQEKPNKFWNSYSKLLIEFSVLIFLLSSVVTIALTICFFKLMVVRSFDETEFFVRNSQALKNAERIDSIFGNDKNFRVHQQMRLYPALDVIIKRKLQKKHGNISETNMLNQQVIDEVCETFNLKL